MEMQLVSDFYEAKVLCTSSDVLAMIRIPMFRALRLLPLAPVLKRITVSL